MSDNLIPADLLARAKARGLRIERKAGRYVCRRGKLEEFAASDITALRRWLQSSASLPIRYA